MTTRAEAVEAAGRVLATAYQAMAAMTPAEAAVAAWTPGGPPVEELEERIRAMRGTGPGGGAGTGPSGGAGTGPPKAA